MTRDGVVREFSDGWNGLVDQLEKDLDKIVPGWTLVQAKEKFGGLRFYINTPQEWGTPERNAANEMIREAENRSYTICEWCGKPGEVTDVGWVRTLCAEDLAKLEQLKKEKEKENGN